MGWRGSWKFDKQTDCKPALLKIFISNEIIPMKLFIKFLLLICICSCHNTELNLENKRLRKTNDSLESILSANLIRPFIDNKTFVTKKDSVYELQLFAAILEGLSIDSIFINGSYTKPNERLRIRSDKFGPIISYTPDSIGEFEFSVQAKINAWNNYKTKVIWPLYVEN